MLRPRAALQAAALATVTAERQKKAVLHARALDKNRHARASLLPPLKARPTCPSVRAAGTGMAGGATHARACARRAVLIGLRQQLEHDARQALKKARAAPPQGHSSAPNYAARLVVLDVLRCRAWTGTAAARQVLYCYNIH